MLEALARAYARWMGLLEERPQPWGRLLVVRRLVPAWAGATTFGRLVLVRAGWADHPGLLEHERVHVEQYARYGAAGFLLRYGWGCLAAWARARSLDPWRWYPHHPLEAEAVRRSGFPPIPGL